MTAYSRLEDRFRRLGALKEAAGVLHWDTATMMPKGGGEARGEQLAALDVACHELITAPDLAGLLGEAEGERLGPWQRANLREMRRAWRHATALEADLVAALARAARKCEMAWREARPANDFKAILAPLGALLALVREAAAAKAEALGCGPYEALLDQWEPGGSVARIDEIFESYGRFLPGFLEQVLSRQARQGARPGFAGAFPTAAQEALGRRLMTVIGFDFDHGRLDVSLHPFCGGVPDDVRITTRYDEANFTSALMAVIHETGHAMYERHLPADWRLQPVGKARGMAWHESQSLLVEMQACRSPEFLGFVAPVIAEAFGGEGPAWQAEGLVRHYHRVERGLIRVDADEVTYPAHVILRYRLEQAMLSDRLPLADLPAAWNDEMERLLGVTPPDDRDGCLQDIHWYDGAWGYFPTYTLGAMMAAQLYDAALRAQPEIPEALGRGDFAPLMGWLRDKVHAQGALLTGEELLVHATGRPLDPEVFERHLAARYLAD
ncbi:MAG TPA: carboxypeptidase M32 [Kiloniellales bacterium]